MKERTPNMARVFSKYTQVIVREEFGDRITGTHDAVEVGVELDGERVWNKLITPFFCFMREMEMYVPKPFYPQRIERAIRQAEKIASKLNRPSK